jgi:GAF domain-containing protein
MSQPKRSRLADHVLLILLALSLLPLLTLGGVVFFAAYGYLVQQDLAAWLGGLLLVLVGASVTAAGWISRMLKSLARKDLEDGGSVLNGEQEHSKEEQAAGGEHGNQWEQTASRTANGEKIASILYHATRQIAQAETADEVFYALIHAMKQTPFHSITLAEKEQFLHLLSISSTQKDLGGKVRAAWAPFSREEIENFLPTGDLLIVSDMLSPPRLPESLLEQLNEWNCRAAAFIPVRRSGQLAALFILGSPEPEAVDAASIQPYANLAELTATALEKVAAVNTMKKRLVELEILNRVSEASAGQSDLETTFSAIHAAVESSLNVTSFFIALYDKASQMIEIPYISDRGQVSSIKPFPLGEGLTSIVINTGQPLMLVENTEERSRELGAKFAGPPAKSWLGVPLVHGEEVLGAIVVQDMEKEQRFNQDDLRLLVITSRQIAAALHSVQLLEQSRRQTQRERRLQETTRKIRESSDMHTILEAAVNDIGSTLNARKARVVLRLPEENLTIQTEPVPGSAQRLKE